MNKLTHTIRMVTPELSLQHLPAEVQHQIFRYVPTSTLLETVGTVNREFMAVTTPWRNAFQINVNIQAFQKSTNNQAALVRFKCVMDECLQVNLPDFVTLSLINSLIATIPLIPAAERSQALSVVFGQSVRLPLVEREQMKKRAMSVFLDTHQQSRKADPSLKRFQPANDEQAALAAWALSKMHSSVTRYSDLQVALFENGQLSSTLAVNYVADFFEGIQWAGRESNSECRAVLLKHLYFRTNYVFGYLLTSPVKNFLSEPAWKDLIALGNDFFTFMTKLIPGESTVSQLNLIQICNNLENVPIGNKQKSDLIERGRWLLMHTPEDQLILQWDCFVTCLFMPSSAIINWNDILIERADAFSEFKPRIKALEVIADRAACVGHLPIARLLYKKTSEMKAYVSNKELM